MRSPALSIVLLVAVLSSGCGSAREDEPRQVADRFETAVAQGDAEAACQLLAGVTLDELEQASGKACQKSLLDEVEQGGTRLTVARFGTQAQVTYRSDVLFLTEGPRGWRVLAAACTSVPGGSPYDCDISGG